LPTIDPDVTDFLRPFDDFRSAATAVLEHLYARLPFGLWMVTRTEGEDWIVLDAVDHGYDVAAGDVFRWSDSFCSRMVEGLGPRIAPVAGDVAVYAVAPIGRQVPIGAYVGVPLANDDGSLFGTLCAIDPAPQSSEIESELPLVELLGSLLATVLATELEHQREVRRAESAEFEAQRDALTGISNRRAWERTVALEEARCSRYGTPAGVVVVDLDGLKEINDTQGHPAGDTLLQATAAALASCVRESDTVARLGGDEFAVLAVESDAAATEALAARLRASLRDGGIAASVGVACRSPRDGLAAAATAADAAMYRAKELARSAG
jgi:diguanylate cyclase